ncbi:hypothetical protein C1646_806252 [Rhizophagus diaphanus]|nr:hypothetical protein C1646_806252 [Rhizophagus diaphanus] [Rhizophagus sp. MUCL 43196]
MCNVMVDRVEKTVEAVKILLIHKDKHEDCFSEVNNNNLQKLVDVICVMREFIEEVTQLTKLNGFVRAKNIKRALIYLNKKLDSTIKIMEFDFMVEFNARADNDNKKIIADIEGLFKDLKIFGGGLKDMNKTLSKVFGQLSILNNTENQMITDQKSSKQSENSVSATLEGIKVSLIEELSKILEKRVNTYQTAGHIERICDIMLDKVQLAETVIENLKNRKKHDILPSTVCSFIEKIESIRHYVAEISELTESRKTLYANMIKRITIDLNKELNSDIQILEFYLMVDFNVRADINNEEIKQNIEDFSEHFEIINDGLTGTNKIVSKVLEQFSVLNNTVNQMIKSDKQGENSANFLPFIGEVRSEILKIEEGMYLTAENNEKICYMVQSSGREVEYLKNLRENYADFFSKANANYIELQKLANNVDAKHKFLTEHLKELGKRDIEKATIYLSKEFDSTIQLLKSDFIVNLNACADRNNEKFRENFDELTECLQIIKIRLTDMNMILSIVFRQLSALNITVNQMITDQKK